MGARVGVVGLGYEGLTIDEFCDEVRRLELKIVVDVRLNALSRKAGFSKNGLRAALAEVGVNYLHMPSLGNPRDNRDGFAVPGSRAGDAARDRYRSSLSGPDAHRAIETIADYAQGVDVGLLCFEKNERECHRELVLEQLEALFLACG
ncbi:MAG: hypothetical protein B7Y93_07180 [Micrococcales bacterium 32-70-13]|nr:MAG: hypothetical protein B7Y93_07180 [Micrococcales bacterium 32-70-13]